MPVESISGGHNTTVNRHAWQLSLQHSGVHFCGAALIAEQWALTSGQCASKYFDLTVRAGSNYTTEGGEVYVVEKIFVHPEYSDATFDSDIALLRFKENITANHTTTAWLARVNDSIVEDSPAYLTGWGYTSNEDTTLSKILQFVQVPARTLTQCRQRYAGKTITENMMCAGYDKGDRTSCTGDYGGPVIIYSHLVGIQSFGQACGDAKHPTIFVRVSRFIPWITKTMQT